MYFLNMYTTLFYRDRVQSINNDHYIYANATDSISMYLPLLKNKIFFTRKGDCLSGGLNIEGDN